MSGLLVAGTTSDARKSIVTTGARDARIDRLADLVERHLDVEALLALADAGAPSGLPVLPPGGGS